MFEVCFQCDSSASDYILLRFLLQALHYRWHTFEVNHNYDRATIYFYSPTDDCRSVVSSLPAKDEEDINIT